MPTIFWTAEQSSAVQWQGRTSVHLATADEMVSIKGTMCLDKFVKLIRAPTPTSKAPGNAPPKSVVNSNRSAFRMSLPLLAQY